MIRTDEGWSEWIEVAQENVLRVPADIRYGVYRCRLVYESGVPFLIRRPRGKDPYGIMYIGGAGVRDLNTPSAMRGRFSKHLNASKNCKVQKPTGKLKDKGHDHYCRFWQKVAVIDPKSRMEFQYKALPSALSARIVERDMLDEFRTQFGEDPDDLWCKEEYHLELL